MCVWVVRGLGRNSWSGLRDDGIGVNGVVEASGMSGVETVLKGSDRGCTLDGVESDQI